MIYLGDCVEVMATLPECSVDAVVCDPPYGIGFMSKSWDELATAPNEARWNKRGRNLDVSTKAMRGEEDIENFRHSASHTGFAEPNPRCAVCGKVRQGSPAHVCKCGDDWIPAPRINRQAQRSQEWHQRWATAAFRVARPGAYLLAFGGTRTSHRLACAIEDAGWIIRDTLVWAYASGFPKSKASLKPAWEPIVMARKPGPLRELAIDACRIPTMDTYAYPNGPQGNHFGVGQIPDGVRCEPVESNPLGRWPANIVLTTNAEDGSAIFDGGVEGVVGGGDTSSGKMLPTTVRSERAVYGADAADGYTTMETYGDTGTYSRFFLIPKADRSDREPNAYGKLVGGLEERLQEGGDFHKGDLKAWPDGTLRPRVGEATQRRLNGHPTVKPVELMRHLVRLVTPIGGTVLDPFLGSGSTAIAAEQEGFAWIGIEKEAEYVAIAEARLAGVQRGLGLDVAAPTSKASTAKGHWPKERGKGGDGYGFTGQTGLEERYEETA